MMDDGGTDLHSPAGSTSGRPGLGAPGLEAPGLAGAPKPAPFPNSPAARVTAFVEAGGRAVVILCPSRPVRAAVLNGVLAVLPGRVVRAGNPLSSPLTLHRLMFQIGAGPAEEDGGLLARRLEERADPTQLAVLAVDDAQTLAPEALAALAQVPCPATPHRPGRLLVLAGHPDVLLMLFKPGLDALHDPASALMVDVDDGEDAEDVEGAAAALAALAVPAPSGFGPGAAGSATPLLAPPVFVPLPSAAVCIPAAAKASAGQPGWSRRGRLALGALAAAAAVVGVVLLRGVALPASRPAPASAPGATAPGGAALGAVPPIGTGPGIVTPSAGAPSAGTSSAGTSSAGMPSAGTSNAGAPAAEASGTVLPDAVLPAAGTAPGGALPPPGMPDAAPRRAATPSQAELRREFDAFLNRAGRDTASLTPADRAVLFRDYLAWRNRGAERPAP